MEPTSQLEDISFSDFGGYFQGKKVLVTGHTGFKGSWLSLWLIQLGAKVFGLALDPPTSPNNYELCKLSELLMDDLRIDVRNRSLVASAIARIQPDIIFHLAAQPIVAYGVDNPFETFEINAMGTASVLDAVRVLGRSCVVVIVTSDKCYQNTETPVGYSETDPLGGSEPYGASKAAAEIVTNAYRETYFSSSTNNVGPVAVASVRAGNVIGGGDWSPHRILPDIVSSLSKGDPITLRSPYSVRPWQHVLVPLSGYLLLAARMLSSNSSQLFSSSWNFGPHPEGLITVKQVADKAIELWSSGNWVQIENSYAAHETKLLTLRVDKASQELGWRPRWNFELTMKHTIAWYLEFHRRGSGTEMRDQCLGDIEAFVRVRTEEEEVCNNLIPVR